MPPPLPPPSKTPRLSIDNPPPPPRPPACQAGLDRMYERLPFLPAWADAVRRLRKDDVLGWDDLLGGGVSGGVGGGGGGGGGGTGGSGVYVKGRNEHQGTSECRRREGRVGQGREGKAGAGEGCCGRHASWLHAEDGRQRCRCKALDV